MSIKEFELYHGAVITQLLRSESPLTLRMIETKPTEAWSTYIINDEVNLVIKHSLSPRISKKSNQITWQFIFSIDQIRQLNSANTWSSLVCASKDLSNKFMEICLIDLSQINDLLDISSLKQQSILVKRIDGKSLRVTSRRIEHEILIPKNRLTKWQIPGS